jgi:hypothetical protein
VASVPPPAATHPASFPIPLIDLGFGEGSWGADAVGREGEEGGVGRARRRREWTTEGAGQGKLTALRRRRLGPGWGRGGRSLLASPLCMLRLIPSEYGARTLRISEREKRPGRVRAGISLSFQT